MEQTVVAIDPGQTTGLVAFLNGEYVAGAEASCYDGIRDFLHRAGPDVVVVENYLVGRGGAHHRKPLMVMGAVELMCLDLQVPVVYQSPGILKIMLRRIEPLGLNSPHTRSAAAHALYYLTEGGRHAKPKPKAKPKG